MTEKNEKLLISPTTQPSFIMLAPMEGVIDHTLRELFSQIGGLDRCVTEFVRVSKQVLPERVFKRYCPELSSNSETRNGTSVYLQLLGDNPELMAANAIKAVQLGAKGIDINFGCPAKTVNNHGGGSVLLKDPDTLFRITHAIRQQVPAQIPVTAKMRLGYHDKNLALDNALAIQDAGASEIAIHGRTKLEAYRPPAFWDEIGKIVDAVQIPVIANGEIWNLHDLQRCIEESKTTRIMLGRGLVACPDFALLAKAETDISLHWGDICLLLLHYIHNLRRNCDERHIASLVKQWLVYLRIQYAEAQLFFEQIKRIKDSIALEHAVLSELKQQQRKRIVSGQIGRLSLNKLLETIASAA